jgi:hypothetical protein
MTPFAEASLNVHKCTVALRFVQDDEKDTRGLWGNPVSGEPKYRYQIFGVGGWTPSCWPGPINIIVGKSKEMEITSHLEKYSNEGYGWRRAILQIMMMYYDSLWIYILVD